MASARSLVLTAGGKTQEAKDADIQLVSGTVQSSTGVALTINSATTNLSIQVGGTSYLTVSSAAVAVANGSKFSGDGSLLTSLTAANLNGVVSVSNGGTGQSTLAAHGPLLGNVTSGISAAGPGTAGQVFTSLGPGADPAMLDPITSVSGISTLGATYTISTDNGAYEDTGLSVTLPSAGTYLVWYRVRSNVVAVTTAGAFIRLEMFNATDSVAVANSVSLGAYGSTVGPSYYGNNTVFRYITVAASKTIHLYANTVAPGSTSTRLIYSDTNGYTDMGYIKVNYV